jgi:hypothetical protein
MEPLEGFVEASLRRAEKALRAAKILLEYDELEDSASRAYYAMFHAIKALLYSKGIRSKSHKGTISLFGEHIIKRGILDREFADAVRKAFDLRQKSDYEIYTGLSEEAVKELIDKAEKLIEEAKKIIGKI